ncbi:hypothetical protein EDB87DRAFT_1583765 [Lactarius vividus]|nr:hypothetical protein EDB87DRAFT_1583765 [Lactarius vividus]
MLDNIKAAKKPRADGVTITPPPNVEIDEGLGFPPPPPDPLQSRAVNADGVTITPPPVKFTVDIDEGVGPPPPPPDALQSRAVNADGVTITPPPVKFTVDIDEGVDPPPPPPDVLQGRAIDAQLLVDRALASSAKALLQSVLNNVKSAKSPPGNGVTAPPPVQPAAPPGNGVTATPPPAQAAAPPGNPVTDAAPPSQPAAPDALPARAFNVELLADRGLASSAKSIFQSVVNDVKSAKSPPGNGVTASPPPVQPVAPPGNGVTATPPPAQAVAPPGNSVTDAAAPPPTVPDALPVRAIDAGLLVDRALASSAKSAFQSIVNSIKNAKSPPSNGVTATPPPPVQPVTPPGNGVSAAPPPGQAVAPPSNSVTDATAPPPVIPDALPVRAVAGAVNRRGASSKRTWASRQSVNLS